MIVVRGGLSAALLQDGNVLLNDRESHCLEGGPGISGSDLSHCGEKILEAIQMAWIAELD